MFSNMKSESLRKFLEQQDEDLNEKNNGVVNTTHTNVSPVIWNPNVSLFPKNKKYCMVESLLKWTNTTDYTLLYNSEIQELTTLLIWKILRGRKNIVIAIETEKGNVFGSYHHKIPLRQSSILANDKKHFVFSLKNPYGTPPIQFLQNERNENQLIIHRDIQNNWIFESSDKSYIGSASGEQINRGYIDTMGLNSDIFNGQHYPNYFTINKLLLIQMHEK
ncbi:TLDc domain-containing protein [Entamoeba marina]